MTPRVSALFGTLALLLLLPGLASAQGYDDDEYSRDSRDQRQTQNRTGGSTGRGHTIGPDWTSAYGLQGAVGISGDLSLSSTTGEREIGGESSDLDDELTFDVDPTLEYFVVDRLALFASLDLQYSSAEGNDVEATSTSWGPSAGVAYYLPVFPNGALYGRAEVGYGFFSRVREANNEKRELEGGVLALGGGVGVLATFGGKRGGFIRFGVDFGRLTGELEIEGITQDIELTQNVVNGVVGVGFYVY